MKPWDTPIVPDCPGSCLARSRFKFQKGDPVPAGTGEMPVPAPKHQTLRDAQPAQCRPSAPRAPAAPVPPASHRTPHRHPMPHCAQQSPTSKDPRGGDHRGHPPHGGPANGTTSAPHLCGDLPPSPLPSKPGHGAQTSPKDARPPVPTRRGGEAGHRARCSTASQYQPAKQLPIGTHA